MALENFQNHIANFSVFCFSSQQQQPQFTTPLGVRIKSGKISITSLSTERAFHSQRAVLSWVAVRVDFLSESEEKVHSRERHYLLLERTILTSPSALSTWAAQSGRRGGRKL